MPQPTNISSKIDKVKEDIEEIEKLGPAIVRRSPDKEKKSARPGITYRGAKRNAARQQKVLWGELRRVRVHYSDTILVLATMQDVEYWRV